LQSTPQLVSDARDARAHTLRTRTAQRVQINGLYSEANEPDWLDGSCISVFTPTVTARQWI